MRQLGMGHTGTSMVHGASCSFFNPGGLSFVNSRFDIDVSAHFLFARTTYSELAPGQYYTSNVPGVGTPFSAYAMWKPAADSKLAIGFGVYTPFGSRVRYEDDWKGQFLLREMSLKTFYYQPTVSYKIGDKIGVGAGLVIASGDFTLRRGVPVQGQDEAYGEATLSGGAMAFGYNAGVFYDLNDRWDIGVSFRSGVTVQVDDGMASFVVPSALEEFFPSGTFKAGLNLPYTGSLGISYTSVSEKFKIALDVNMVGWKAYDSLVIDFDQNTDKLDDLRSARHYENSPILRLGAEYYVNDNWTARVGGYYDMTPVQDGYLTPETPDANKWGITAGASLQTESGFGADLAVLFIEGTRREDTNLETQFSGSWKARALSVGVGLHYKF